MRKVKAKGGPLDGKTVLVHENDHTFAHHADAGGSYVVEGLMATWEAKASAADTQAQPPAPKPARRRPAPKPKPVAPDAADSAMQVV